MRERLAADMVKVYFTLKHTKQKQIKAHFQGLRVKFHLDLWLIYNFIKKVI